MSDLQPPHGTSEPEATPDPGSVPSGPDSTGAQVWDPMRREWVEPAAVGAVGSAGAAGGAGGAPSGPVWDDDREAWGDGRGHIFDDERGEWVDESAWDDANWVDDLYVPVRADDGGPSRWLVVALSLFAVVGLFVLSLGWWVRTQVDPGNAGEAVALTIPSGATTADVARLLETKAVIGNPTVFEWYLRFAGGGPFKAGDYEGLRQNQSMGSVIDVLDRGPLAPPVATITLPEGLWVAETRQRILEAFPEMDPAALDAALAQYSVPIMPEGSTNPEGVLFPATYPILKSKANDPDVLLAEMAAAFERVSVAQGLPDATAKLEGAAGRRSITPYEALTVASMVEAEARIPEDRAKIARVIYNRLKAGMRLDIDATVLYALGDRKAPLTQSALRTDSPFNTRLKSGLPPTPINSPGEASIEAALAPAEGDWLYYVLADENGAHYFTNDFGDFNRAVGEARDKGLL